MEEFVWVEKYRPRNLEELILPEEYSNIFQKFIDEGKIPNLLFTSTNPGLGKTSLARILAKETNADILTLNGNRETGIDHFRGRLIDFCSSLAIDTDTKIVFIDEAENLSSLAVDSLKSTIEQFTNVSFIFTANFVEKIPEAVRNRLQHYDFDEIYYSNKKEVMKSALKRLIYICEKENITYKKEDLLEILKVYYPSIRGSIKILQQLSMSGELVLTNKLKEQGNIYNILLEDIKNKNFGEMRQEITKVLDPGAFYTFCFKNLDFFEDKVKPKVILTLAKYQDMDSRARDKQINLDACLVELMLI